MHSTTTRRSAASAFVSMLLPMLDPQTMQMVALAQGIEIEDEVHEGAFEELRETLEAATEPGGVRLVSLSVDGSIVAELRILEDDEPDPDEYAGTVELDESDEPAHVLELPDRNGVMIRDEITARFVPPKRSRR